MRPVRLTRPRRLPQPTSIRGRAVASAAAPLLAGSVLIAGASVAVLGLSLPRSLDAALTARVGDVIAQLEEPGATANDPPALGSVDPADPILVEVRSLADRRLAVSAGLPSGARLCPTPLPSTSGHDSPDLSINGHAVPVRRQVTVVATGRVPAVVCAARRDDATRVLRTALFAVVAFLIPTGVALVLLLLYRTVSRALQPVERLTQQAARLSDLDAGRLPLPGTDDEIDDLAVTLNQMLDRLHEQAKAGRRFVADAGHELRSPLATLRVAMELAAQSPPDDVEATLAVALADLERLERLAQDLLVLATTQIVAPERPGDSAPGHLSDVVDLRLLIDHEVSDLSRRRTDLAIVYSDRAGGCEALTVVDPPPALVRGDERALSRMLRNLLDNAARHAHHRVDIELDASADQGHGGSEESSLIVHIRDDGRGIPAEDLVRVFEPFVRLDDARRRDDGGSGLGLSIVAATVTRHRGTVHAHPEPGGHLEVRLPRAEQAAAGSVRESARREGGGRTRRFAS